MCLKAIYVYMLFWLVITSINMIQKKKPNIPLIQSPDHIYQKYIKAEKEHLLLQIAEQRKVLQSNKQRATFLREEKQTLQNQCFKQSVKMAEIRNQIRLLKKQKNEEKLNQKALQKNINKPVIKNNHKQKRVRQNYNYYYQDNIDVDNMSYEQLLLLQQQIGNVPRGLTFDQVQGLKRELYKNLGQIDERCSICMDDYKGNDTLIVLNCSHCFHEQCLVTWAKQQKLCPLCKDNIL